MSAAKFDDGEAAAKAVTVLDAAEASILFARGPGESGATPKEWRERAAEQLALSFRLAALVSSTPERAKLQNRADQLMKQLERERDARLIARQPNRRLYDDLEKRY